MSTLEEMLEAREAYSPDLLMVFVLFLLVTYLLLGKGKEAVERKDMIQTTLSSEESKKVESFPPQSDSLLVVCPFAADRYVCAWCFGPATSRCSRCKSVRYCSGKCQIIHWRQGHKHACQQLYPCIKDPSNLDLSLPKAKHDGRIPCEKMDSDAQYGNGHRNKQLPLDKEGNDINSLELNKPTEGRILPGVSSNISASRISKIQQPEIRKISFQEAYKAERTIGSKISKTSSLAIVSPIHGIDILITEDVKLDVPKKPVKHSKGSFAEDKEDSKVIKTLFPYDEFVKFFSNEIVEFSPRGLLNCGNSCYVNAILQCLTCTKPLVVYLLQQCHSRTCRQRDRCLMCTLEQHVSKLKESGGPLSPAGFLSHLQNIGGRLNTGGQEDAHEFLRLLVASMQSLCLAGLGDEKNVDARLQETTFIQQTFGGILRSRVKCLKCHHESERYENFMDLTLEILCWVESLEDALAQFTFSEDLDGENMYRCGRCSTYVKAKKQLNIHEAPNILTIVLKRFQTGKYGKISKCITFPEMLDMSPYMTGTSDVPPLYMLYGAVVHLDTSNASFSGHYISYVKDLQGAWFRIDDTQVEQVSFGQVVSEGAYVLFYARSFPRPPRGHAGETNVSHSPAAQSCQNLVRKIFAI